MSNLSPELKNKLTTQVKQGAMHYHTIAEKYLRLDEQVSFHITKKYKINLNHSVFQKKQSGFNVENFAKNHGLLKFVFVRHPFDRYV